MQRRWIPRVVIKAWAFPDTGASEPLRIGGIPRDPGQKNARLDNRARNQKTGRKTETERDQWQGGTAWLPLSPDAGTPPAGREGRENPYLLTTRLEAASVCLSSRTPAPLTIFIFLQMN